MRILLITNDSTVFLSDRSKAKDIFGGRVTEVKGFLDRLERYDITFKIVTGRYGLVDGNDVISKYQEVADSEIKYKELQKRLDYASSIKDAGSYDFIIILLPKGMVRILIENDALHGNIMAVTSLEFLKIFKERGWHHFERKGARIGKKNAENMIAAITAFSSF